MKSILIRPNGHPDRPLAKRTFGGEEDAFDMLSFLANEFDNHKIEAVLLEVDDVPHAVLRTASASKDDAGLALLVEVSQDTASQLATKLKALRRAARDVVARWENGDLANVVRELDRVSQEV